MLDTAYTPLGGVVGAHRVLHTFLPEEEKKEHIAACQGYWDFDNKIYRMTTPGQQLACRYKLCAAKHESQEDIQQCKDKAIQDLEKQFLQEPEPLLQCYNRSVCSGNEYIKLTTPNVFYKETQECLEGEKENIMTCCNAEASKSGMFGEPRKHCKDTWDFYFAPEPESTSPKVSKEAEPTKLRNINIKGIKELPIYLKVILIVTVAVILFGLAVFIYGFVV